MHYWREGRGSTLLLLHGWPEFCRTWRRLYPAARRRVRPDRAGFRGFGDTEKPDPGPTDAMTVDVLAEDMRALLDALGLDRPVGFVSHDVGAYVTQASRGAGRSGPPACSSSTAPTPASAAAGPSRSISRKSGTSPSTRCRSLPTSSASRARRAGSTSATSCAIGLAIRTPSTRISRRGSTIS